MPTDQFSPRTYGVFAPLNSTEIAILGGKDERGKVLRDIVTFDTRSGEFKKEMEDESVYFTWKNESLNICESTIFASLYGDVIKF